MSGRLVAPGDAAGLAGAILSVLSDPQAHARMGAAGRARVRRDFDIAQEAAWLGILFCAAHDPAALRPPKRPTGGTT